MMLCIFGAVALNFFKSFLKIQQEHSCYSFRSVNTMNEYEYYYRPQPGYPQQQQFQYQDPSLAIPVQQFPGLGQGLGGGLGGGFGAGRIERLEREVNFLQRQTRNLERRVDRLERRLGFGQF
ncbi:MAG: hypothetical protein K0R71_948 [Bacillales bacterium]|jgi:hypothetical protein|nr:hypothetical protein [Bacillales bacterium]